VRQDGILLRLVESMDLVDEEDRAQTGPAVHLGLGHDLSQVRDAGRDGRDADQPGFRLARQQSRQGRLAASGRTPQHDARQVP
jgi:hypothetical protein